MLFSKSSRLSKDRFDQMFSYFKYLVSLTYLAIAMVLAIGVWFLGKSLEDVRNSAERIATDQAKRQVEESFKEPNIQKMIDSAASKVIRESLQSTFKEQIERAKSTQTDPLIANFISEAIRRAQARDYSGILDIQKVLDDPKTDDRTMSSTKRLYNNLVKDYESLVLHEDTSLSSLLSQFGIPLNIDQKDIANRLTSVLLTSSPYNYDIYTISSGYIALRKLTGIQFQLFDRKAIERWQKKNFPKSGQK